MAKRRRPSPVSALTSVKGGALRPSATSGTQTARPGASRRPAPGIPARPRHWGAPAHPPPLQRGGGCRHAPGQRTHCAQHPHQRGRPLQRRLQAAPTRRAAPAPPHGNASTRYTTSQQFVQIAPDVVRKPLPQRDDQHGREEPHRPLAHVFRQVAEGVEPPVRARPHRAAHQRDQQVFDSCVP